MHQIDLAIMHRVYYAFRCLQNIEIRKLWNFYVFNCRTCKKDEVNGLKATTKYSQRIIQGNAVKKYYIM